MPNEFTRSDVPKLNTPELFKHLSEMNEGQLKNAYGLVLTWGPSMFRDEATARILNAIVYELNARESLKAHTESIRQSEENRRSYKFMLWLTFISIGLSAFQAVIQLLDHLN